MTAVSCTLGAVISAFSFSVDPLTLVLIWSCSAFVVSVSTSFWRLKGLLVLPVPLLALLIWRLPEIAGGARWAAHYLTSELSQWLFLPVLFPDAAASVYEQTLFFAFFGVLLSMLLSVSISLKRSVFLTVLFTLPFVFLTFVAVYYPAELMFLLGLLAVYLTQLFSNSLYPYDFVRRGLAVFPALALALALIGVSFIAASTEDNYTHNAAAGTVRNDIRAFSARVGLVRTGSGAGWLALDDGIWGFNTDSIDISNAGRRVFSDQSLLEIISTHAGTFYLRGYSMMLFDGNSWTDRTEDSDASQDHWARGTPAYIASVYEEFFPDSGLKKASMSVSKTGDKTDGVYYHPYFSFPALRSAAPENFSFYYLEDSIIDMYYRLPPGEYQYIGYSGLGDQTDQLPPEGYIYLSADGYGGYVHSSSTYLSVDENTAEGLRRIAAEAGVDISAGREEIAEQVAEFFFSFGTYTLSPQIVRGYEDFALYFLETSQQGYCIHYATAATLMLRALGVPARFTAGYVATVAGHEVLQTVEVKDANAHAWVEVFYETYGWLPLEVTPHTGVFGAAGVRTTPGVSYTPPDRRGDGYYRDGPEREDPGRPEPPDNGDADVGGGGGGAGGDDGGASEQILLHDLPGRFALPLPAVIALAVIAAIVLRIVFSKVYRRLLFGQADTNQAIICAWRHLARLVRRYKWDPAPKEIEDLALKARFSQHRMSESERDKVVCYARKVSADIRSGLSFPGRFWARCVLGL